MNRYLDGRAMDDVAIQRIQSFEQNALEMHSGGYWVGDSGGKDSTVVLDLVQRAGVPFTAHFSYSAEPPEVVRFIRKHHPDTSIEYHPKGMFKLIETNGPPTRINRWCCRQLKERGGAGRFVIDGVRAAESPARRRRRWQEACWRGLGRQLLHPIFDWSTSAVWEYIHEHNLPYCSLYDEGRRRVGCVMCPKANRFAEDAARWPKFARAYRRALARRFATSKSAQRRCCNADDFYEWWISGKALPPGPEDNVLFEDDPGMIGCAPRRALGDEE